jgi:hypothetical protein
VTISVNYTSVVEKDYDIPTLAVINSTLDRKTNEEYCLTGVVTIGFKDTGVGIDKVS